MSLKDLSGSELYDRLHGAKLAYPEYPWEWDEAAEGAKKAKAEALEKILTKGRAKRKAKAEAQAAASPPDPNTLGTDV